MKKNKLVIVKNTKGHIKAYNQIKKICIENGFDEDNLTVMTLMLPFGCYARELELMKMIKELMGPLPYSYVVCIEPNRAKDDKFLMKDTTPLFHAHLIVNTRPCNVKPLRKDWTRISGNKSKKGFDHGPLEKKLSDIVDYLVKEFKLDHYKPIYGYRIVAEPKPKLTDVIGAYFYLLIDWFYNSRRET